MNRGEMNRRLLILTLLAAVALHADGESAPGRVRILKPNGGQKQRAGTESLIALVEGEILFDDDTLFSRATPVEFEYCPAQGPGRALTLPPRSNAFLTPAGVEGRVSPIDSAKLPICPLPDYTRTPVQGNSDILPHNVSDTTPDAATLPPEPLPADLAARASAISAAIVPGPAADNRGPILQLARLYRKAGLPIRALQTLLPLKDSPQEAQTIFDLKKEIEDAWLKTNRPDLAPRTVALLAGVDHYQKVDPRDKDRDRQGVGDLSYAAKDATLIGQFFGASESGQLVDGKNLIILKDPDRATLETKLELLKTVVHPTDRVVIFLSMHGWVPPSGQPKAEPVFLAADSLYVEGRATGISMATLADKVRAIAAIAKQVVLLVNACHAGTLGSGKIYGRLAEVEPKILGIASCEPAKTSQEDPTLRFENEPEPGHGVFGYYLLEALRGKAPRDEKNRLSGDNFYDFIYTQTRNHTSRQQSPSRFGTPDTAGVIVLEGGKPISTFLPPIESQPPARALLAALEPDQLPAPETPAGQLRRLIAEFESRPTPDLATRAAALAARLPAAERAAESDRLRTALAAQGQQVILDYLRGDRKPQTPEPFADGRTYFRLAREFAPDSRFLECREEFCAGRLELFERDRTGRLPEPIFQDSVAHLERALHIDPDAPYLYNALGIAYLENGVYDRAIPAFRDAIARASRWPYPVLNLALAYSESGRYADARQTYLRAITAYPDLRYFRYNLALLYQRYNRPREAYRELAAVERDAKVNNEPDLEARSLNAKGTLDAEAGRLKPATAAFEQAAKIAPELLESRYNLAGILSRNKNYPAALAAVDDNLARDKDHFPSLLRRAEILSAQNAQAALDAWQTVAGRRPDYLAAHLEIIDLAIRAAQLPSAAAEVQTAVKDQPQNPLVLLRKADLQWAQHDTTAAIATYREALARQPARELKSAIRRWIKELERSPTSNPPPRWTEAR